MSRADSCVDLIWGQSINVTFYGLGGCQEKNSRLPVWRGGEGQGLTSPKPFDVTFFPDPSPPLLPLQTVFHPKRRHQTSQKKNPQNCRGTVGTSTRAVAYAFASQSQPLLCAHPTVLSHGHENLLTDLGDDLLSNDLLLSPSALLFSTSSHSDDAQ